MPRRCWAACLRLLLLFGVNSSVASSGCSDRGYHSTCEAQSTATTAPSLILVQALQVHSKEALHYEDDEPQTSGSVLMQRSNVGNKTASAEGIALTQQPGVADRNASVEGVALREQSRVNKNASVEGPHAGWHARWHAWQLSCQNTTLVLAELGSRVLQAAWAFCNQTMSRASKAPLIMGSWVWLSFALALGLSLTFIAVSSGPSNVPSKKGSMRPTSVDMLTLASVKVGQRVSTPGDGRQNIIWE